MSLLCQKCIHLLYYADEESDNEQIFCEISLQYQPIQRSIFTLKSVLKVLAAKKYKETFTTLCVYNRLTPCLDILPSPPPKEKSIFYKPNGAI